MRGNRNAYRVLVGQLGRRAVGKPRCRREIILKCSLQEYHEVLFLFSSGSEYRPVAGSCEDGNEPLVSLKLYEVLEYLSHRWLVSKVWAQVS
jgi:hypothetical protein